MARARDLEKVKHSVSKEPCEIAGGHVPVVVDLSSRSEVRQVQLFRFLLRRSDDGDDARGVLVDYSNDSIDSLGNVWRSWEKRERYAASQQIEHANREGKGNPPVVIRARVSTVMSTSEVQTGNRASRYTV